MHNDGYYPVPRDINFKAKFIGGFMTFPQLGWIAAWVAPALGLAGCLYGAFHSIMASLIALVVFSLPALVFAYVPVDGYEFFRYLRYAERNSKLPHYLIKNGIDQTVLDPNFVQVTQTNDGSQTIDEQMAVTVKSQKHIEQSKNKTLFQQLFEDPDQ